jgi:hypothetical protein
VELIEPKSSAARQPRSGSPIDLSQRNARPSRNRYEIHLLKNPVTIFNNFKQNDCKHFTAYRVSPFAFFLIRYTQIKILAGRRSCKTQRVGALDLERPCNKYRRP